MASPLTPLPIGIQSFSKLREGGYQYVDKTERLYNLIQGSSVYFVSRPRRFGKSLMISTLQAIFQGKKELFNGLWIKEKSDYNWPTHPVIRIDMTQADRNSPEQFNHTLIQVLARIAATYQLDLPTQQSASTYLDTLISALHAKHGKVVVLVDEYDKPILDNILDTTLSDDMRHQLRQFYNILKAQDDNIRFIMLTGVTKFSKVSIFSGLNNLENLTIAPQAATLFGYTQAELEQNFPDYINTLAKHEQLTRKDTLAKIKHWYNGYCFSPNAERVYNPFSTLLLFKQQFYRGHWYETGTPSFLLELITIQNFNIDQIEYMPSLLSSFLDSESDALDAISVLYQAGYVTIKQYDAKSDLYWLGFPNFEVQKAFMGSLLQHIAQVPRSQQDATIIQTMQALNAANYSEFFNALKSFLASIPYELHYPKEKAYQLILFCLFKALGYQAGIEVHTNTGGIDAILEMPERVLIFEFKLDRSAKTALQQIHDKAYYLPYLGKKQSIHLFGVNFSTKERNITDWIQEDLTKSATADSVCET